MLCSESYCESKTREFGDFSHYFCVLKFGKKLLIIRSTKWMAIRNDNNTFDIIMYQFVRKEINNCF